MGRKFHAMHGRDHQPGGADPIPNLNGVRSLYLWSSFDDGDSSITVPAFSGINGVYNVEYAHKVSTTGVANFWNSFEHNGSTVTSPLIDTVVVPSGLYLVDAWWKFLDDTFNTWLGAQLNMVPSGSSVFPNRFYTASASVDASIVYGANDPQNPSYTGQLEVGARTFYVPSGQTGRIYTDLFHKDNRTISLPANWTLGIHKLS